LIKFNKMSKPVEMNKAVRQGFPQTETQTNSTVVPKTGVAFVRNHYVIYGSQGFDIIYVCT
jgi:hypothetical protein